MIESILDSARKDLLDLTARNRLIHTRRNSTRSSRLDVVDELSDQIFRILVTEGKQMTFLGKPESKSAKDNSADGSELEQSSESAGNPNSEEDIDEISFAQPDEEIVDGVAERHQDTKLQTNLVSEKLQKKLLRLYYDARTSEDEQGINTLYLALGYLKWFEDEKSDVARQAPLILIPIRLERKSANARFKVKWSEEEITTNLSIQAKIWSEFGIELPDIPDSLEFKPSEYFSKIQDAISDKKNWEIIPNGMVIWFFSFAKFLMYKDLENESWPDERKLSDNRLICSLLDDGFSCDPNSNQDQDAYEIPINKQTHVVDADSSQSLAIEETRIGRDLVIQGPPGTGKSQTITNLIASAVAEGKKVLFVAEKMAALQVVKSRMDQIGLGDACIELHSNKANKKAFLLELEKTLNLGRPSSDGIEENNTRLDQARELLNLHVCDLHQKIENSGLSAYQVIGQLVRLSTQELDSFDFELKGASTWSRQEFQTRRGIVHDLSSHLSAIGNPNTHIWNGVRAEVLLQSELTAIQNEISKSLPKLAQLHSISVSLGEKFGLPHKTIRDCVAISNSLRHVLKLSLIHI